LIIKKGHDSLRKLTPLAFMLELLKCVIEIFVVKNGGPFTQNVSENNIAIVGDLRAAITVHLI
jgi:hypothetical protein